MTRTLKKGFTLLELIVVIAIISILVLLATRNYTSEVEKAKLVQIVADTKTVSNIYKELLYTEGFPASVKRNVDKSAYDKCAKYDTRGKINKLPAVALNEITDPKCNTALEGTFLIDNTGNAYYVDKKSYSIDIKDDDKTINTGDTDDKSDKDDTDNSDIVITPGGDGDIPLDEEETLKFVEFKNVRFEKQIHNVLNQRVYSDPISEKKSTLAKTQDDKHVTQKELDNITYLKLLSPTTVEEGTTFLADIQNFKNLQGLEISFYNTSFVKDFNFIEKCRNLTKLSLQHSDAEDISGLRYLNKVQELDLYDNKITSLNYLRYMKMLNKLNIGNNKLNTLGKATGCQNLQYINAKYNKFDNLAEFSKFRGLKELEITSNPITTLKGFESNTLKKLTAYNMSKLENLDGIEKLPNLETLILKSKMKQSEAAKALSQLHNLKSILLEWDSYYKDVFDISYLYNSKNIERIEMQQAIIKDSSKINVLKNLKYIEINEIDNLETLAQIDSLETIKIRTWEKTIDLSPLLKMKNLKRVVITRSSDNPEQVKKNEEILKQLKAKGVRIS